MNENTPQGCPGEIAPKIAPSNWKSYVRCHKVEACPLTRGDYCEYRGQGIPPDANPAEEGYLLRYPDGYVSWCPKAQFEAAAVKAEEGLPYGYAMILCRFFGKNIQRSGWMDEGDFVRYALCFVGQEPPSVDRQQPPAKLTHELFVFHSFKEEADVLWHASQEDMQACDWRILD